MTTDQTSGGRARSPRTRFFAACAAGGLLATVLFAAFVFRDDPFGDEVMGEFYDGQARSLLHGRWNVADDAAKFERFRIDGKDYGYFGPMPAVLRMPVIAFTDELDGRLSRVSMLLAFVVLLVFVARVAWQARVLVRGDGAPTRAALFGAAGFVFLVGVGSPAFLLGARTWVYNEAILWAVAWAVACFSFLASYLREPRGRTLVWTASTATLAALSRASIGLGAVFALGVLLGVVVVARIARARVARRGGEQERRWYEQLARALGTDRVTKQPLWTFSAAFVAPLVLYMYVNASKFGSLLGVPYDKQDVLLRAPERRAALAANGGSLFGVSYAPANLLAYFRPDGISFSRLFPFVAYPGPPPHLGSGAFDNIEPTASLTVTAIALVVLAILGIVAVVRPPMSSRDGASTSTFRLPLLGAGVGAAVSLVVAAIAPRYEGDFLPVIVIAAAVGLFWCPALWARWRPPVRVAVASALVVLGMWSCWSTFGLALQVQRQLSGFNPPREMAAFVETQLDIDEALGTDTQLDVRFGDEEPKAETQQYSDRNAPIGRFFVVGDCDAVFLSNGRGWSAVEAEPPDSRIWHVTFDGPRVGTREPLWATHLTDAPNSIIWARWVDDRHVRLEYEWTGSPEFVIPGKNLLRVPPGEEIDLTARLSADERYFEVKDGDRVLLLATTPTFVAEEPAKLGRQPERSLGPPMLDGSVTEETNTPICDRLLTRVGDRDTVESATGRSGRG